MQEKPTNENKNHSNLYERASPTARRVSILRKSFYKPNVFDKDIIDPPESLLGTKVNFEPKISSGHIND